MELYRAFNDLKIDLRSLLLDQKTGSLERLLDNAIEARTARMKQQRDIKEYLVDMLISRDNFSLDDLLAAMEFRGTGISLDALLDEPKAEGDMKRPVVAEFPGDRYVSATRVPMMRGSKAPKIDLAVVKRGIFNRTVIGFELEASAQRGEVLKAFARAREYLRCCDGACVVLSPMTYMKQYDLVHNALREYDDVGVWVANRRRLMAELLTIQLADVRGEDRDEVIRFVDSAAKRKR